MQHIGREYEHWVNLVFNGDLCDIEPTTVINLINSIPKIMHHIDP